MKKTVLELSDEEWKAFRAAKDRYDDTLRNLYPVGTCWWCNHGTHGKYKVVIKDYFPSRGRFQVENVETHAIRFVHWMSLLSGA